MNAPPVPAVACKAVSRYIACLIFVVAALLLAFAASCTTVKRVAVSGGPPAIAAGIGALGGPVVAAVAAGVTAVVVVSLADNADLRSGETMSEEQVDKELARWRGRAYAAEAEARSLVEDVEHEKGWWKAWAWRAFWALLAYLGFRNRAHLLTFGPGYLTRLRKALLGSSKREKYPKIKTDGGIAKLRGDPDE